MAGRSSFDEPTRARLIAGIRAGRPMEEAAHEASVTVRTAQRWLARGRKELQDGEDTPYAALAREIESAQEREVAQGLSRDDLVRLLERQARKGHIRAIHLLLERPWDKSKEPPVEEGDEQPEWDVIYGSDDNVTPLRPRKAAS